MQDLLDRAFFLNLPSAVAEVISRRGELEGAEVVVVETELIDALEHYSMRRYEDTEAIAKRYLENADFRSSSCIAYSATLLARCYATRGQSQKGLQLLELPEVSKQFVEPLASSTLYWLTAHFLRVEKKFIEAKDTLQRAYDQIVLSSVPKNAFRIISDMANVHLAQGDEAMAITLYEKAISEFEIDPDFADALIRARCNLASAYQRISRDEDALRVYDEILVQITGERDWSTFIVVKLNRAIALRALKRMEESLHEYSAVRLLSNNRGDYEFEIRALIGLANHCSLMKQINDARSYAADAEHIATERGVKSLLIESRRSIASIEHLDGNVAVATKILSECFDQYVEWGNFSEAINVAKDLVDFYSEAEEYKKAMEIALESARIQRTIYEGEIERSVEIASVRERFAKEKEAVRARDEERTKVLHAVMPAHIANRLTAGERQIVDTLPAVTILFADVVGFTELVSSMTGEALLELLSQLFAGMDLAASRFGCERIKTIGDSYMAICGASESLDDHIERIVRMALAVVNGEVPLPIHPSQLRIGINTGPVIAGVMDGQRVSYDVWGDTVNVAARMEEHSRPGSINCTEAVAKRIMNMPEFRLIQREPLNIHGKGLMTTYWIESTR